MYFELVACCTGTFIGPGIAEGDENCKKFLEKTMPDSFNKVSQNYTGCEVCWTVRL